MSLISFKRQLSADLERITSRNHGNRKTSAYPKSASTFRKLGSTSQNQAKPARRFRIMSGMKTNNSKKDGCTAPPPSRREFYPSFQGTKQCDWTREFLGGNRSENSLVNNYPSVNQSLTQSQLKKNSLRYPAINLPTPGELLVERQDTLSQKPGSRMDRNSTVVFLPGHRNLHLQNCSVRNARGTFLPDSGNAPGMNLWNSSFSGNKTSCKETIGTKYQISDRRKRPAYRLVVNVPNAERQRPVVMFSYKHGRI